MIIKNLIEIILLIIVIIENQKNIFIVLATFISWLIYLGRPSKPFIPDFKKEDYLNYSINYNELIL